MAIGVGNAAAQVTCSYDDTAGQLYIIVSDQTLGLATTPNDFDNVVTVKRGGGGGILVNGNFCIGTGGSSATTSNVDQINVIPNGTLGADGDDTLIVDESGGPFVPGFTQTELGLNEIEWFVDLGFGANNIYVKGSAGSEGVTAGQDGATTNWDGVTAPLIPVGLPINAADIATLAGGPQLGDFLVNLNAGNLTDADADIWVANGNSNCAAVTGCSLDLATFNLDGGNNTFIGKGGDGTGVAVCGTGVTPDRQVPLVIQTGAGDDTVIGSECSDIILVGGGVNFVEGNGPNVGAPIAFQDDVLGTWEFDPTATLFTDGGDLVDFSGLAGPATITLNPDGTLTSTGITGTFSGIEGVIGTNGNDTINGNDNGNFLSGAGGDDNVSGNGGDDVVAGDTVVTVNDIGIPESSNASDAGNDTLAGDLGDDVVSGGPKDDTLDENAPLNADGTPAYGPLGNGADALDGGSGIDTVDYSARTNRTVVYLGLISTFNDGADTNGDGLTNEFDDVFNTTENVKTGSGDDIVSANFVNNRANNVITDNGGNDCLEGGPGNDTFEQGSAPQGADVMIGNTGSDTANYSGRSAAVQIALDGVANDGDIATNEGDNVGGFSVSCRPQTIIVNPPISAPIFFGNTIQPNGGFVNNFTTTTDVPVAGPAPDCVVDIVIGTGCVAGETLGGDQSPLANVDVENGNGGAGDDKLVGDSSGNVLNGNAGNDTVQGGASNDQLNGGDGDDTIAGGTGNDAIDGGTGTNQADYSSAGAGGVGVHVNLTTGQASGDGNDTLKDIQNVNGSSFEDSISGDANNNVLNGNGGADSIAGNAGDDTVNGGQGNDQLSGQTGADKITGSSGNDAMQGGADNDWLQGGTGRDTILGQKGDDKLYGNAQPDFLNGGKGNDVCKPGSPGLARGDVVVNCEK